MKPLVHRQKIKAARKANILRRYLSRKRKRPYWFGRTPLKVSFEELNTASVLEFFKNWRNILGIKKELPVFKPTTAIIDSTGMKYFASLEVIPPLVVHPFTIEFAPLGKGNHDVGST